MLCRPPSLDDVPGDRGAAALEYLAAAVVVAGVIVALALAGVGSQLARDLACVVRSVATQGGDCGGLHPAIVVRLPPPGTGDRTGYGNVGPVRPPPVDPARVEQALDDIRHALDGGWNGVRAGELTDIEGVLAGLSGPELDAVVAAMSQGELRHWVDQLEDGRFFGGWSRERRLQMWAMIVARASPDTLRRLAALTDDFQPTFSEVGGDTARDNPTSPANTADYGEVPHELFVRGEGAAAAVDPSDVRQGQIGDCWYVASVMAAAQGNPDLVTQAIRVNPNGTYTVTFHDGGRTVEITVTPDIPVVDGRPVFIANPTSDAGDGVQELWPMVLEKAAAQYFGDYHDIEGDWPSRALNLLSPTETTTVTKGSELPALADLAAGLDAGGAVLVSTDHDNRTPLYDVPASEGGLVQGHAYYVSAVDGDAGTVTVTNPWGPGTPPTVMTYQEFQDSFIRYDFNDLGTP
jgi:hypothetical protein